MRLNICHCIGAVLVLLSSTANATTFTFNTDPFAGTNVLSTPGRQIVAGEQFISFSPSQDIFSLDPAVFGTGSTVNFVNGITSAIPSSGVNVVVLETFDNDNNPATPFGAGNAADLIASRVTTPGPGFFIYFNQALNLPRLVYSTDLSSSSADLKVLARMINLTGAEGMNALPSFTADNFAFTTATPEPSTSSLFAAAGLLCVGYSLFHRKRTVTK
jgi:hypothetical protein